MECKNCRTPLTDQSAYCYACGGKVVRNRLTIRNLFEHFSETFLNYDNKFFQTFINLFKKPEDVIGSYIDGTRKKYVDVISFFAIAITITGIEYFILHTFYPEFLDLSQVTAKGTEQFSNEFLQLVQKYQSFALMLFVPVYALMGRLVFLNIKKYNYTEVLVIFMYIIAQMTIVGSLIIIPSAVLGFKMGIMSIFIMSIQIAYSAYCLKRLYGLSFLGMVLKSLLFLVVLFLFYILFTVIFMILLFLINGPDFFKEIIEAQRAAKGT
ncbi:MAG: DUF3667 domain-containing protein [Gelidibacter sp.]